MNRRVFRLMPVLLVILLGALFVGPQPHARALPTPTFDSLRVNVNAPGPPRQLDIAFPVGSTFTISTEVVDAPVPYESYRTSVAFTNELVAVAGSETPLGGATVCSGAMIFSDHVFDSCARPSGTQTDTGETAQFTLKCVAYGDSELHLLTDTEAGAGLGSGFVDGAGNYSDQSLIDAHVVCLHPTGDAFAVDADAATPGVQSSVTVLVGNSFTIASVITSAPDAYSGYDATIAYDDTKLTVASGTSTPLAAGGLCAAFISPPGKLSNDCDYALSSLMTATGSTANFALTCDKPGKIPLHLVTDAEAGTGRTDFFFGSLGYAVGPTQDATVNCIVPVTKTDDVAGSAVAGGQVTYTIAVDDTYDAVADPFCCGTHNYPTPGWIVDTIPAPFTYVSDDRGCTVSGSTIACFVGPPLPFTDVHVTVAVPLSAAGQQGICNTATFVDDPNAPTPVQLGTTATDCIDVQPVQLTVTKSAGASEYHAGDPISWTITVADNGGSPASDVSVADTAGGGFTITGSAGSAKCSADPVTPAGATFNCGLLAQADGSQILTVTGVVDDNPPALTCTNSVTVTASNTGPADTSSSANCLSSAVRMLKDTDGDLAENSELANLFLGGPPLVVNEWAVNVGGDPQGVGAFEFDLGYDNRIFDVVIQPTGWLYSTGRIPGAPGIGGCSATIITENSIRFGCVSENPTSGATGCLSTDNVTVVADAQCGVKSDGIIATITVTPKPDLFQRLTPGNDNGVISSLLDQGCELADIWGHPLSAAPSPSGVDALGREIPLPGILPGGQLDAANCQDIAVTARVLEGDMNTDCAVDVTDDQLEAAHYGATFGSLLYEPWFDLEPALKDGDVDVKDLQKVFGRNGSTCDAPIPPQVPLPPPGG